MADSGDPSQNERSRHCQNDQQGGCLPTLLIPKKPSSVPSSSLEVTRGRMESWQTAS